MPYGGHGAARSTQTLQCFHNCVIDNTFIFSVKSLSCPEITEIARKLSLSLSGLKKDERTLFFCCPSCRYMRGPLLYNEASLWLITTRLHLNVLWGAIVQNGPFLYLQDRHVLRETLSLPFEAGYAVVLANFSIADAAYIAFYSINQRGFESRLTLLYYEAADWRWRNSVSFYWSLRQTMFAAAADVC